MLTELTESVRETIKSAARKLTGFRRRQFQAETAIKYCQGNPRRAEQVFGWAKTMTWRGVAPIVHLLDRVYETGVRLSPREFRPIATRLERSELLPKWSLVIHPETW
jgi:hypothetical protein